MKWLSCALVIASVGVAEQKAITTSKGWVKAPTAGATTATAFAVVENPTMYDVYLVSATSDAAGAIEFRSSAAGGAPPAAMEVIEAPAYGRVELKPDGVHMLLKDLKRPLKAGDTVTIVLTTDNGATIDVAAEVRADPPAQQSLVRARRAQTGAN
jgi:copper(I)-binding protein